MTERNFNAFWYKLYVLCLPFGRLIELPFGNTVNGILGQLSTSVMLVGVACLVVQGHFRLARRVGLLFLFWLFMAVYSLAASCVLTFSLFNPVESPMYTCLGDIVLYFLAFLSIWYNWYNLSHAVSFRSLYRVFNWQLPILLVVGYLQLGTMLGVGPCVGAYTALSSVLALVPPEYLWEVNRGVTMFGSEPASASILCALVIPYVMSRIVNSGGGRRLYFLIVLLLFGFLMLLSGSSSVLVQFLVAVVLFVLASVGFRLGKLFYIGSFLVGLFIAVGYTAGWGEKVEVTDRESLEYIVVGKALDRENMSTAMRASTVINDMKVFLDHPVTGVGNGNQGFWFKENTPFWVRASEEVQEIFSGRKGIANGGGNFFPAYVSGFGLIGIFMLLAFVVRYHRYYKTSVLADDETLRLCFDIGVVLFLFTSWFSVGLKNNETMLFLLSLPCVTSMYGRAKTSAR